MTGHDGTPRERRRLLPVIVALLALGAALGAVAIATGALRPGKPEKTTISADQEAEKRCRSEVLNRLIAPEKATVTDLRVEAGTLDVDGRDFSSLTANESLRGVDAARITVRNVSGVANAPSEVGSTIRDRFDCRTYFVDGALVHTLVVFDHAH